MTRAVELAQIASAGVSEVFKNRIINGNFDFWQRGTSSSGTGYLADRWLASSANSVSRSTDVPNSESQFSISVGATGGGYSTIDQYIEAANCRGFNGPVTISFWAKSITGSADLWLYAQSLNTKDTSSGGVTTVSQRNYGNPSTSWTRYTFTFTGNSTCETNGMRIFVFRDASGTNTTLYSQFQVEAGSSATSFEHRPIAVENALCHRYCQTITNNGETAGFGFVNGSTNYFMFHNGSVPFRASPTISYSTNLFATNYSSNLAQVTGVNGIGFSDSSTTMRVQFALNGTPSTSPCGLNPSGGRVILSAEIS